MIDTHAHLADKRFDNDRDIVIKRFTETGVKKTLCICCDFSELEIFRELINKYSFIYGAIGVHPHDASRYTELLENKSFLSIFTICVLFIFRFTAFDIGSNKELPRKTMAITTAPIFAFLEYLFLFIIDPLCLLSLYGRHYIYVSIFE